MRLRRRTNWHAMALDLAVDLREIERLEQKRYPDFTFTSLDRWEQAMSKGGRR